MSRWTLAVIALCAATGCSSASTDAVPTQAASRTSSPDAFAGRWRSVTPSLEFMGLSVVSKSSEQGVLAVRLTFSGVAWEGSGRIDGDSLVANMAVAGTAQPVGVLVARSRDAQTLRVQGRPASAAALDLTFVRED